ncbi:Multi antimicrobial extrusion protein (Na(+)/drug antiporter), MATE family of MDR efflux pumps [Methanosarcina barkeri str. Wiesmoor]|uniref:Multi antimicrobial extrusion protein (Na(+)/drug antiporter), MATE family of MDR efflux pumps n=1 Tax=Methanosarcina barkeri str. Wiesmoor TaxID=1434109 RepID=A0A0E3QKY1_METBA|nr:Multi antimicrobial extrusion protein (Na(+)/drug antiporter), MATE family of MDR efflux pumps [Methanosarcina barkeri str. Wiesmoor]
MRLWRKLFEKIISGLDEEKIATVIAFSLSGILLALYFFSG